MSLHQAWHQTGLAEMRMMRWSASRRVHGTPLSHGWVPSGFIVMVSNQQDEHHSIKKRVGPRRKWLKARPVDIGITRSTESLRVDDCPKGSKCPPLRSGKWSLVSLVVGSQYPPLGSASHAAGFSFSACFTNSHDACRAGI